MPSRPEEFVTFLAGLEDFDQLELSSEDTRRAELYEIRKQQAALTEAATDLEAFYRSLKTVLIPEEASAKNIGRIVQLFQKTNQFNLTTRRHDRAALEKRMESGSELWSFRAVDVHGDHGIIAVALLDFEAGSASIDSYLMSCRVIGRTLETAILHFLEERALARGCGQIIGEYAPTAKNSLCKGFYQQHGFSPSGESELKSSWLKDLDAPVTCPEWIAIDRSLLLCPQN
jgi:FkbH-like protein